MKLNLPYENFIRFCISQGNSVDEIQEMFRDRIPFLSPDKDNLKRIFFDLLEDFNEITGREFTLNSKNVNELRPAQLPENDTPILLNRTKSKREIADKLNLKEFWAVVADDRDITGVLPEKLSTFKRAFEIFEDIGKPKRDICLLHTAEYPVNKIQELIKQRYDLGLSGESLKIFFKYFWNMDEMSWSDMDKYITRYIDQGNVGKQNKRLLKWALNKELHKLAYSLGYRMKAIDEEQVVQDIVYGEMIDLDEHYHGDEEINAYERNKMTATMRQAVLFAKGYRELMGQDSPDDIQHELVNPDEMELDGHREDDSFNRETLNTPDESDIDESDAGDSEGEDES